mgnify:CR=1 FL=1
MLTPQFALPLHSELVVDLFAGGGGASTGIEQMKQYGDDRAREVLDKLQERIAELEAIRMQQADTIIWQAGEISKHLDTIEASRKQEAVAYEFRMRAEWVTDWGYWSPCTKAHYEMYICEPKLHGWIYETRALYADPVIAPDVLKDAERYRWLRDKPEQSERHGIALMFLEHDADGVGSLLPAECDRRIDAAMTGGQ